MDNFISASEYAEKYKIGVERVRQLCKSSRIPGAYKIVVGGMSVWLIPHDATDPRKDAGRPRATSKSQG
jgi:hypothetical protein